MKRSPPSMALAALLAVMAVPALAAQPPGGAATGSAPAPGPPPEWSFSAGGYWYHFPDDDSFGIPLLYADRGPLHLEARYNYEDLATTSLFAGWKFEFGDRITTELTPLLGVVAGNTEGIAPGLELAVTWGPVDFYNESEYVFDRGDREENFLYAWSELGYSPADWIRVGLVGQRTRRYETEVEIQRGLLVGSSYKRLTCTLYYLNPFDDSPFLVLGLSYDF